MIVELFLREGCHHREEGFELFTVDFFGVGTDVVKRIHQRFYLILISNNTMDSNILKNGHLNIRIHIIINKNLKYNITH